MKLQNIFRDITWHTPKQIEIFQCKRIWDNLSVLWSVKLTNWSIEFFFSGKPNKDPGQGFVYFMGGHIESLMRNAPEIIILSTSHKLSMKLEFIPKRQKTFCQVILK